jgi:DNA adenine methylase
LELLVTARPFLKWAGGKGQLLPELSRRLPEHFARYHEPFVGGGAFFFYLWNNRRLPAGALLSDFNPELIDCYRAVRDHVEDLIELLQEHKAHTGDKAYFYAIRFWDRQPDFAQRPLVERAARTIFLNRTCYNGLYRLNNKQQFNAPFGYYKNPLVVDPDNMREVSHALQDVDLQQADFGIVLERADKGDLVYFDPPYYPLSQTASFTSYTHRGFGEAEQRRLADVFGALIERGCYVMISNSSTEFTNELYSAVGNGSVNKEIVKASRKINCDGRKRGFVDELIVSNYSYSSNGVH